MNEIKLDMNSPEFQEDFVKLEKRELGALANTLKKVRRLTWDQFYRDQGLKWEEIKEKKGEFTFRFSKKYRAVALRDGEYLRLISLHADHDSAYH